MKKELRNQLLRKRKAIVDKYKKDSAIIDNLLCSSMFDNAQKILFYASLEDEIDTFGSIRQALKLGKHVYLPACLDKNGKMDFYEINSLDQLKSGSFGVREPDICQCSRIDNYDNVLCIVPGVAFDKTGYRMGYGKGYYDRFLSSVSVVSVGLCYDELLVDNLPLNEYDIAVNFIVTESRIIKIN